MNKASGSGFLWRRIAVFGFCWLGLSMMVHAQTICPSTQGYNAVWGTKSPNCTTLEVVGSQAFIDASAWCPSGDCSQQDFCTMVHDGLLQLESVSPTGGVVDARGVVTTQPPLQCASNPFSGISVPSTVLLPPLRIQLHLPWILQSNTRISGQSQQTNLQAFPSFVADSTNAMIEMGAAPGSSGVVVEHLELDGSQQTGSIGVGGIYNGNAQDGSYVNDVTFYAMGALTSTQSPMTTGLLVDTGAAGSGPYTNIVFSGPQSTNCNNNSVTCKPTAAVQIRTATRGLHGITATTRSIQSDASDQPLAGIYLDASNNTIEEAHFEGFYDGIVVGANENGSKAAVAGNSIMNINGGYGGNSGPMSNLVHVCNSQSTSQTGACSSNSVSAMDLAILGAESLGNGVSIATIKDDLTGTVINQSSSNASAGVYILGEPLGTAQYSRFTTSLGSTDGSSTIIPTWAVGSIGLGTGAIACSTPGALYSNTSGTGSGNNNANNTLYLCSGGDWLPIANNP